MTHKERAELILLELKKEWPEERFWQHDIAMHIKELIIKSYKEVESEQKFKYIRLLRDT